MAAYLPEGQSLGGASSRSYFRIAESRKTTGKCSLFSLAALFVVVSAFSMPADNGAPNGQQDTVDNNDEPGGNTAGM